MTHTLKISQRRLLADTLTPVNIYLKLRDQFAGTILLESSDYHGHENSLSLICCDPIASFKLKDSVAETRFPDGRVFTDQVNPGALVEKLDTFRNSFEADSGCGLFGYINYDTVRYF